MHKSCTNCKHFHIWSPQFCKMNEPVFNELLDCVSTAKQCKSWSLNDPSTNHSIFSRTFSSY